MHIGLVPHPNPSVLAAAKKKLAAYRRPGNILESANVLDRGGMLTKSKEIGPDLIEIPDARRSPSQKSSPSDSPQTLDDAQCLHIESATVASGAKIYGHGAAERMRLKPTTLQCRMENLGISARRMWMLGRARRPHIGEISPFGRSRTARGARVNCDRAR